jgi:hypothetical protein
MSSERKRMRRSFAEIENEIDAIAMGSVEPLQAVKRLLICGEDILITWVEARDSAATDDKKEGFRLLALQRQGCKGDPSFNACRETARELAYQYNLVTSDLGHSDTVARVRRAAFAARHLCYFVSGKLEVAGLGEFCCASKPVRQSDVSVDEAAA